MAEMHSPWKNIPTGFGQPNPSAAGVLLGLGFLSVDKHTEKQWCFRLIKRASRTVQGGDIGAPGGMLHPWLDPLLRFFLVSPLSPVCRGAGCHLARQRGNIAWHTITLFLANALREAWEEIGLYPWDVQFLGPLPAHSLVLIQRTIFPVCGWIKRPRTARPNREVARVIDVPLNFFYDPARFGRLYLEVPDSLQQKDYFPCLVLPDGEKNDLLWGATFKIVIGFLHLVMDYELPDLREAPVFRKALDMDYLTGSSS